MSHSKFLGIYMDHSTARLVEFSDQPLDSRSIDSKFTNQEKEETLNKSEQLMHNKEQHEQAAYYKQLSEIILNYNRVLLFGPTQAKNELENILRKDIRFNKIEIVVKPADKMTEHQQHAFVKDFFTKYLAML